MNVIPVQWAGRQRASKSQAINMAQSTKNNPILRIHCSGDTRERERERANDYSSHVTLWEETRESAAETSVRGRSCPLTEAWPAMGRGGNPPGCCLASAAALPPCRPAARLSQASCSFNPLLPSIKRSFISNFHIDASLDLIDAIAARYSYLFSSRHELSKRELKRSCGDFRPIEKNYSINFHLQIQNRTVSFRRCLPPSPSLPLPEGRFEILGMFILLMIGFIGAVNSIAARYYLQDEPRHITPSSVSLKTR